MKKGLVMLVEDNDSLRLVARKSIESKGFTVEDYSHGLSAFRRLVELHAARRNPHYNMIFSDIDMPHMDGIEFATECAKVADGTPIVLMTGLPRESYPLNVKEVLKKPLGVKEYHRVLDLYALKEVHRT